MIQVMTRFAAVVLMSLLCSHSFAGIMINPLASTALPAGFDGSSLSIAASESNLQFTDEILNQQTATSGFLSVSGIQASGPALSTLVGQGPTEILTQPTTGGSFELTDDNDNLLLSGNFGSGAIGGTTISNEAGFGTDNALFNGGSLLDFIDPEGSFSLSLILDADGLQGSGGSLGFIAGFDANFTAQIDVLAVDSPNGQVPEPGSVLMFSPILLMGLISRRRARKV